MRSLKLFNIDDAWKAIEGCPLFNPFIVGQINAKAKQKVGSFFYEEIFLGQHGAIRYTTGSDGVAMIRVSIGEACLAWLRIGDDIIELEGLDSFMPEIRALGADQKTLEDFC